MGRMGAPFSTVPRRRRRAWLFSGLAAAGALILVMAYVAGRLTAVPAPAPVRAPATPTAAAPPEASAPAVEALFFPADRADAAGTDDQDFRHEEILVRVKNYCSK